MLSVRLQFSNHACKLMMELIAGVYGGNSNIGMNMNSSNQQQCHQYTHKSKKKFTDLFEFFFFYIFVEKVEVLRGSVAIDFCMSTCLYVCSVCVSVFISLAHRIKCNVVVNLNVYMYNGFFIITN